MEGVSALIETWRKDSTCPLVIEVSATSSNQPSFSYPFGYLFLVSGIYFSKIKYITIQRHVVQHFNMQIEVHDFVMVKVTHLVL